MTEISSSLKKSEIRTILSQIELKSKLQQTPGCIIKTHLEIKTTLESLHVFRYKQLFY